MARLTSISCGQAGLGLDAGVNSSPARGWQFLREADKTQLNTRMTNRAGAMKGTNQALAECFRASHLQKVVWEGFSGGMAASWQLQKTVSHMGRASGCRCRNSLPLSQLPGRWELMTSGLGPRLWDKGTKPLSQVGPSPGTSSLPARCSWMENELQTEGGDGEFTSLSVSSCSRSWRPRAGALLSCQPHPGGPVEKQW